jgi:hypothetical protein
MALRTVFCEAPTLKRLMAASEGGGSNLKALSEKVVRKTARSAQIPRFRGCL